MKNNRRRWLTLFPTAALASGLLSACPETDRGAAPERSAPAAESPTAAGREAGAIGAIDDFIAAQNIDRSNARWKISLARPPELSFDSSKHYFWVLDTNAGPIKIELMPEVAPMHVSSTIYLSRLGFYDGVTFHRVIPGFMAQGGDPLGNGRGGPGYTYDGEFDDRVKHDRPGLLSMANAGPGTDGSQFFITFVPTPHLDGKHTIFGEVVEGMETVKELERRRLPNSSKRAEPLVIRRTHIEVN